MIDLVNLTCGNEEIYHNILELKQTNLKCYANVEMQTI